jgi:glutamate-5-semialdehyde dehydrogenase
MVTDITPEIKAQLNEQIELAAGAAPILALLNEADKNQALELIERELLESVNYIIEANQQDLDAPENAHLSSAMKDRLKVDTKRINSMAQGIRKVINIPDPISRTEAGWNHPNGMNIKKVTVPIGTIGIIYEARPNVTTDAIALCIKSGNSCVLRGSKQAWHTNNAIMEIVYRALAETKIPVEAVQFLKDKSRESAKLLLRAAGKVDLIIPRGGETLKNFITENSLIPVLGAGGGNCHVYVDQDADLEKAVDIIINAKTQRPSVCNALESVVLHSEIKDQIMPILSEALIKHNITAKVEQDVFNMYPNMELASDEDWGTEYLDLTLSIRTVDNLSEAIEHINLYASGHSDAIITEDINAANQFTRGVNSACVYVNASTRFTDGEEFGFGAEIGISTAKGYVRGPIGANELCTYKYIIEGSGQIR